MHKPASLNTPTVAQRNQPRTLFHIQTSLETQVPLIPHLLCITSVPKIIPKD